MALAVVMALLILGRTLPLGDWVLGLAERLRGQGTAGAVLYAGTYLLGALFGIPSSVFSVGAGFAYGPLWGVVVGIPGATLSSVAVFTLARFVLRGSVERMLEHHPRWRNVDLVLEKHGPLAVVLLRLSPLTPFNLLNYVFGLTSIRTRHYAWASLIGVIPGVVFYTQLGSLLTSLMNASQQPTAVLGWTRWLLLVGSLLLTLGVVIWLGRLARRALADPSQSPVSPRSCSERTPRSLPHPPP